MSKNFKIPTLAEITRAYLDLLKARYPDAKALDSNEKQFQSALGRIRKTDEIREALALDTERILPVQLKSPAYERLLSMEGRTIPLLREYAQEMYEYGAAWTAYADRLWDEADLLEEEE